jgi:hypothetical protein
MLCNPLNVALGIPSRGHSSIFPAVMQTSFLSLREKMFTYLLAGNGRLFLTLGNVFIEGCSATERSSWFSRKRVSTIRYLAVDISLCSRITCHNMFMSPVGLGTNNHCARKGRQKFSSKSVSQSVSQSVCQSGITVLKKARANYCSARHINLQHLWLMNNELEMRLKETVVA